jgi:hypothetical protein
MSRHFIPREGSGYLLSIQSALGLEVTLILASLSAELLENHRAVEQSVRTTNKSMDAIPAAWLSRKVFQPWEVRRPVRSMYLATVV